MFARIPGCHAQPPISLRGALGAQSARAARLLLPFAATLLLLGGASGVHADALTNKSDAFLRGKMAAAGPAAGWTSVIVTLNGRSTPAIETELKALGADLYRRLPLINSVATRVPTKNLRRLAAQPFVVRLSSDVSVRKNDEFTVASSLAGEAWQDTTTGRAGLDGAGVGIAVVDSGVRPCRDLKEAPRSRIVQSVNFVSGAANANDTCGHGTHVAGIIAGNGAASTGNRYYRTFYGIAPRAEIVSVRVLDEQGQSDVSTVVAGIDWVVRNRTAYNIRVLNLSLGHPIGESYATDPLCRAVEQAWRAGIVVVCSAGNAGRLETTPLGARDNEGYGTAYGTIQSPGNSPYAITVGAMKSVGGGRANDQIATYSSRGPSRLDLVLKPDIVAPGNKIVSLLSDNSYLDNAHGGTNQISRSYYTSVPASNNSNRYFRLSGTSMAAPVVTGAVALMLQKHPRLAPDTVKARLMLSADKWVHGDGRPDPCTFGAGYLNIPAALHCTAVATEAALSPTLTQDAAGNVLIDMDRAIWGVNAIWGTGVSNLQAIWGVNAIWGANVLTASQTLWSANVWADRAIWTESTGVADLSATAVLGDD